MTDSGAGIAKSLHGIRGWIYVMSNKAIPNLVKIGFTLKDPKLRARELKTTGVPHLFVVEYEALVENPRDAEQQTHKALSSKRENKEWFRCSVAEAVTTIKGIVRHRMLLESDLEDSKVIAEQHSFRGNSIEPAKWSEPAKKHVQCINCRRRFMCDRDLCWAPCPTCGFRHWVGG